MEMQKEIKADKKKRSGWVRALEILLRTGHIGSTGVVFGGALFAIPFARLIPWHQMAIATGAGLVVLGICQSRHWPYQLRGVMAITHVGLFGLVRFFPEYRVQLLAAVLVLGAIGSHMPSGIRHWSLVHGRRID
ncbi:MAG: hypothetical protein HXX11_20440 [Desulfuromonadales bacterium]|nr:hypothetical protein [Desulfuromonadales bacterium]